MLYPHDGDPFRRVANLISAFAEASYYVFDAKAYAAAEAAGWPDKEPDGGDWYKVLDADGVEIDSNEVEAATLNAIYPQVRELLVKQNPEAWAYVLKAEAEKAADDAEREAEAKAAGFESYEAQQEAKAKARRSASAKQAAETRKAQAEGWDAVRALEARRDAERQARWAAAVKAAEADGYEGAEAIHRAQTPPLEPRQH